MYYIVHKITRETVQQMLAPFNILEAIQPPDPYIQLKGIEDLTVPAFNPLTHRLERTFTDDDAAKTRTFRLTAVPLSAPEVTAATQRQTDEASRTAIVADHANMAAGAGTAAQRLARLEKAVAYLLRYEARG